MNNITDLIPQRPPIVMVDAFVGIGADNISTTRFTVRDDNLFVDDGELDECGLIEHIAQSAAARVGYLCRESGKEIPLGYIGSVNKFELMFRPRTNDEIETRIEILQEVFNISLIEARCTVGGACAATCRMKIFLEQE